MRWVAALLCLLLPFTSIHATPLSITVVLSEQGGQYLEFYEALRNKLLGKNIAINMTDSVSDLTLDKGVVVAAGMKAAEAVAASNAPSVLNVFTPEQGYKKLLEDFADRRGSKTFSAIFLDQPIERHLRLIRAMLPNKRHIGVLSHKGLASELAELRQRAREHRLILHEKRIQDDSQIYAGLQEVLYESEVLFALPDASIYNASTMRNILMASYRSGDPMIGFSPGYVRAGALAAVYSTPEHIAEQAVKAILQYGETRILPAPQHPQLYEVLVNEQVARSLGIDVKTPAELHQAVSRVMGDEP